MSSPRALCIACLALCLSIAAAPRARADEPTSPDPRLVAAAEASVRAEKLAQRKRQAEAEAEWARAAAGYRAVWKETGDDNLRLPLAVAEEGRGELVAAAVELRALAKAASSSAASSSASSASSSSASLSSGAPVRPEIAAAGAARLAALLPRLAQVTLTVTPRRTAIRVGLTAIAVTPLDEPLLLAPGAYTFALEANGYRGQELVLTVAAGQRLERAVSLVALAELAPKVAPAPPLAAPVAALEPPSRLSPLVLAGAATAGVLVVAGVGTGLTALHRQSQFEDEPSASRRDGYADSGRRWALATDVLFGAALAVAAGTAYLYFRAEAPPAARGEARAPHRVHLVPWAGADSAGIGVAGAL